MNEVPACFTSSGWILSWACSIHAEQMIGYRLVGGYDLWLLESGTHTFLGRVANIDCLARRVVQDLLINLKS